LYKPKNFGIKELVSRVTFQSFSEAVCWQIFDPLILQDLQIVREEWEKLQRSKGLTNFGIVVNNWASGGSFNQCGYRCNLDQLVQDRTKQNRAYLSAHTTGRAFDLHASDNNALWELINKLIKAKALRAINRLEAKTTTGIKAGSAAGWVHMDGSNVPEPYPQIFTG